MSTLVNFSIWILKGFFEAFEANTSILLYKSLASFGADYKAPVVIMHQHLDYTSTRSRGCSCTRLYSKKCRHLR